MDLEEARRKYLYKVVRHHEKPWLFEIENVDLAIGQEGIIVKASFRHLYYDVMPPGQPLDYPIEDVEKEFVILG